jgi:hypothetical protein
MKGLEEMVLDRSRVLELIELLGLIGVVMFLPFVIHQQWITGPIINAILILILFLSGLRSAIIVSFIPSFMALSGGLLPPILAPVLPFIILSNVIYVITIDFIYHRVISDNLAYGVGVLIASILKFLFLFSTTSIITKLIAKPQMINKIIDMMSWSQFATALTGGIIAFLVLKWLKRI